MAFVLVQLTWSEAIGGWVETERIIKFVVLCRLELGHRVNAIIW